MGKCCYVVLVTPSREKDTAMPNGQKHSQLVYLTLGCPTPVVFMEMVLQALPLSFPLLLQYNALATLILPFTISSHLWS